MIDKNKPFPYTAWALSPSFKPTEVLIEEKSGFAADNWVSSSRGKYFSLSNLFLTKAEAVADGWLRLEKQEADMSKKQANIDKRKAALRKATP